MGATSLVIRLSLVSCAHRLEPLIEAVIDTVRAGQDPFEATHRLIIEADIMAERYRDYGYFLGVELGKRIGGAR